MEHTQECIRDMNTRNAAIEVYEAKWPNYCKTCGGSGAVGYYDDPIGEPWSSPQWLEEPCDCVEDGICPRCGKHAVVWLTSLETFNRGIEHDYIPYPDTPFCALCGWLDNAPRRPEPYESSL